MAKRTKAEAQKTRQELIENDIAQFAQHGVSKTTLNDIRFIATQYYPLV